jgi:hypothetical protein
LEKDKKKKFSINYGFDPEMAFPIKLKLPHGSLQFARTVEVVDI